MSEVAVEAAFARYLEADGWTLEFDVDHLDIRATRGNEVLLAEVKGHTKSAGTAVDIGFGQILRRMNLDNAGVKYCLVVPDSLAGLVERTPRPVRERAGIDVFVVDVNGSVTPL